MRNESENPDTGWKNEPFFIKELSTTNIMTDLKFKPNGDCIFIHIPKTAGLSINESVLDLEKHFDWYSGVDIKKIDELLKEKKPSISKRLLYAMKKESSIKKFPQHGAVLLGHIHYKSLIDNGKLSQEYFDNSFKFAFVRNPYDRLVSLYKYHKIHDRIKFDETDMYKDFDMFVETLYHEFQEGTVPPVGLYNIKSFDKTSRLYHLQVYGNQYQPMVAWLPKHHASVMICYLETFEQDIDKLLSVMGYEGKRAPVPKINKSKYDDNFMDFYSNRQTIDLVNKLYKDDFETFGYDML